MSLPIEMSLFSRGSLSFWEVNVVRQLVGNDDAKNNSASADFILARLKPLVWTERGELFSSFFRDYGAANKSMLG